jgi:DNA-binding CsgD family transcriptional regulator
MSQDSQESPAGVVAEALSELLEEQHIALGAIADRTRLIQSKLGAFISLTRAGALRQPSGIVEISDPHQEENLLRAALMGARRDIRTIQNSDAMHSLVADWLGHPPSRKGVGIRIIIHSRILQYARAEYSLAKLIGLQAHVRVAPLYPFQLVMVDDKFALVRYLNATVVICQPTILLLISRIFEYCWDCAEELPVKFSVRPSRKIEDSVNGSGAGRSRLPTLSAEQRAILRLWAQGRPDDIIARELQVSIRTLRRMVSILMNRLGVNNRFMAGIVAAQRYDLFISDEHSQ